MNCEVIATGSGGNAVLLNDNILIDCGVSYKAVEKIKECIKLVLLTHIHSDHFKRSTIKRLAFERPGIRFGCGEWLRDPLLECGVAPCRIDVYQMDSVYNYGAFKVSPVAVYHDVPNCGYRVFSEKEKAIYITDTVTLDGISAPDYDLYLVEANYNEEAIKEKIRKKQSSGQYAYELKSMKRHLSEKQCNNWLYENMGRGSEYIYLHRHIEKGCINE